MFLPLALILGENAMDLIFVELDRQMSTNLVIWIFLMAFFVHDLKWWQTSIFEQFDMKF